MPTLRRGRARILGLGIGQLLTCEAALAGVAVCAVVSPLAAAAAGLPAAGVLALSLVRVRRRFLYQWLAVALAYRHRRSGRRHPGHPTHPTQPTADPRIELLRELSPALQVQEVTNRSGVRLGAVTDGRAWCALLEVLPDGGAGGIVEPGDGPAIPYRLLADSLEMRGIRLAAIQVLTHTVPSRPDGQELAFVRSYQRLTQAPAPPRRRTTWIVLRLEPELCPDEVALRGGGGLGARRALLTTASRLTVGLRAAGVPVRPLDAQDALTALVNGVGASPWQQHGGRRTAEHWTTWTCDGAANTTFWIRRWPPPTRSSARDLLARIASGDGLTTTVSVVLSGRDGSPGRDGGVSFRTLLRLSGAPGEQLTTSAERLASTVGAELERLDGLQAPGVLATLPLGGGAR